MKYFFAHNISSIYMLCLVSLVLSHTEVAKLWSI
ncbi:hypothetical protein OROGR_031021 [Orobanche gracilis]